MGLWENVTRVKIVNKFYRLLPLVACITAVQSCSRFSDGHTSIQVDPPHTAVKYLDDIYFRQKSEFGRAYTVWSFICRPSVKVQEKQELRKLNEYVFEVTDVDMNISLEMSQTLPYGVKNPLRLHEDTHCNMTAEVYKDAPRVAKEIAREMIGKKIVVSASESPQAAKATALLSARTDITTAFRERVADKADALAVIFDRVTRHGMNGVTNEEGSKQSFDEYNKTHQPTNAAADIDKGK